MSKQFRLKTTMTPMFAAVLVMYVASSLAATQAGSGQSSTGLLVDVSACLKLKSNRERRACYEQQVDAALNDNRQNDDKKAADRSHVELSTATGSSRAAESGSRTASGASLPVSSTIDVTANPREIDSRASQFGFLESSKKKDAMEFIGTIAGVREVVPGRSLITLENGQVWRKMSPDPYPMRIGDSVKIYESGWGKSYRLAVARLHGFIQVERLR